MRIVATACRKHLEFLQRYFLGLNARKPFISHSIYITIFMNLFILGVTSVIRFWNYLRFTADLRYYYVRKLNLKRVAMLYSYTYLRFGNSVRPWNITVSMSCWQVYRFIQEGLYFNLSMMRFNNIIISLNIDSRVK